MKILFFGDVIGRPGREAVKKILPKLKEKFQPNLIIINGENLAHGTGLSSKTTKEMFDAGVNLITGGNHSFKNEDGLKLLDNPQTPIIRPLNYPSNMPGRGSIKLEVMNQSVIVFNLVGQAFMKDDVANPFKAAQEFIRENSKSSKIIILDWHAEATSEKIAMGKLVDGQISAVFGTHTHVPTADWEITKKGTAFVSDVGMCGVKDSVIGVEKTLILKHFLEEEPVKFELAQGDVVINAVSLTVDDKNGKAIKFEKINELVS
ncbi:TIGR00282 family metallophosphoesterase [Candidatus Parcubacteria bacterium]|nr:MAG: TIGR00282 family metallophosphoesterase [Candidatus Parcubacteria bacterium]